MARTTRSAAAKAVRDSVGEIGSTKKRAGDVNGNGDGGVDGHTAKRLRIEDRTDFSRWRMRDDESRHTWHYLEDDTEAKKWPQTLADKYFLGLPLVR